MTRKTEWEHRLERRRVEHVELDPPPEAQRRVGVPERGVPQHERRVEGVVERLLVALLRREPRVRLRGGAERREVPVQRLLAPREDARADVARVLGLLNLFHGVQGSRSRE